jgi:hypothetical protein
LCQLVALPLELLVLLAAQLAALYLAQPVVRLAQEQESLLSAFPRLAGLADRVAEAQPVVSVVGLLLAYLGPSVITPILNNNTKLKN